MQNKHTRKPGKPAASGKKYANPISSRADILKVLNKQPMSRAQLSDALKLKGEEKQEALRRRLRAMVRDGQLVENRRGQFLPVGAADLISGRVIAHVDGFGFLKPDEGDEDLYLSPWQMRQVLHGDRAVVRVANVDSRGRLEGAIVEVIERAHETIVGRYAVNDGIGIVVPENKRITHDVLIPPGKAGSAKPGEIVLAELLTQPAKHQQPTGKIIDVLGEKMAPGMEIQIALHSHDLPHRWDEAVLDAVKKFGDEVPESAKQGRLDLRDVPLVTIDGADAKDFDDAVYCERRGNGWRLLVAIADVAAYVEPDSVLDAEATKRATSVYFPSQVIPMLPEVLSNGLCSLNPKVDRLCMVCEIRFDTNGKIKSSRFSEGLMRSHARLTYDEVAAMLFDGDKKLRKTHDRLLPHLENLHGLFKVLLTERRRRGAIDFETVETKFEFDNNRKIARILPRVRNDAHRMIEECMIAANRCAARFLKRHKIPALYRVHAGVKEGKVDELREFLSGMGLFLGGGEKPKPADFSKLLQKLGDRPDREVVQTVLLRSLDQAVYGIDHKTGHFGLALADYAHFTSPIRRYPDLVVHRAIRHILRTGKSSGFVYEAGKLVALGEHCSMCERRADEASRDVEDWLKCEYMQDRIGEQYDGIVTGVTSFGLFVRLEGLHVEGLIHITALPVDYYHFDPATHRLVGKRSKKDFRLGDTLEVRLIGVNLDERKIDFELLKRKGRQNTSVYSSPRGAPKTEERRGRRKEGKKRRGKRR